MASSSPRLGRPKTSQPGRSGIGILDVGKRDRISRRIRDIPRDDEILAVPKNGQE